MSIVEVKQGLSPIILASPHGGVEIDAAIWTQLNERGKSLTDTDWHINRLYDGLLANVTTVRACFHRYVIDANRAPNDVSLYPGQNTTSLVPTTDFDGFPIWKAGQEPTMQEIKARVARFHAAYHAALAAEIARIKALHGVAVLYDCHSIRTPLPFLFEGNLPHFNIGTNDKASCANIIEQATLAIVRQATGYTHVLNGRFKGGWTTRHYGKPREGVHAIQMELAQSTYLQTQDMPFAYDEKGAQTLRVYLQQILTKLEQIAYQLKQDPQS